MGQEYLFDQKIVVFGGGTGQFNLLRGLVNLNQPENITAIPGTWDSGGSSGKLRTELGALPPGDARQCLIALMEDERQRLEALRISNHRFRDLPGPLRGHDPLNLLIELQSRIHQGHDRALDAFRTLFRIRGYVIPSSLTNFDLIAKLESGREIFGEEDIDQRGDKPDFNPEDRITSIFLDTPAEPNQKALDAIEAAQKIIFSSGSLWGSVLPHLLIEGIPEALIKTQAILIFVLNLMTERGQTDGFTASDHLRPFIEYLGDPTRLNFLIANQNCLSEEVLVRYRREGQVSVTVDEEECIKVAPCLKIICQPLASYLEKPPLLRHDPEKLARLILTLS